MDIGTKININQQEYQVLKLLGHGKGGYSYLVSDGKKEYVLKQIHHEPCSYYQFGNKIEAEKNDYERLLKTGIRIPKMLYIDIERELILKEYIDGPVIIELVEANQMKDIYIEQVKEMASLCYKQNLNIDYYPTNFVVMGDLLYYIDYECNTYMDNWNLENWGLQYWVSKKKD